MKRPASALLQLPALLPLPARLLPTRLVLSRLLLAWLVAGLLLACVMPAMAQPQAHTPAPVLAPGASAAQAREALDVLRDDKKRAALIAVLEAMAKAAPPATAPAGNAPAAAAPAGTPPADTPPATAPAPGASPAGAPPAAAPAAATPATGAAPAPAAMPIPLAPDSLGARLAVGASDWVAQFSASVLEAARSITDFPLIGRWLVQLFSDPVARALLITVSLKLAGVVALALLAQYGAARLLRRPIHAVERRAPAAPPPHSRRPISTAEALAAAEAGQTEPFAPRGPHAFPLGPLAVLRRLPYALARFALQVLPLLAVVAVGYAALALGLGAEPITRLVLLATLNAYLLFRLVTTVAELLCAPEIPRLRLLPLPDAGASYLQLWATRIAAIAIFGYGGTETALLFGLYRLAHDALLKLVALAVMLCLVVIVLQLRNVVARLLASPVSAEHAGLGFAAQLRQGVAPIWHIAAIFYLAAIWVVWALEMPDGFSRLLRGVVLSGAVLAAGWALDRLLVAALRRGIAALAGPAAPNLPSGWGRRVHAYHPFARALLRLLVRLITALGVLAVWGMPVLSWFRDGLGGQLVASLGAVGISVLVALVIWETATSAMQGQLERLEGNQQIQRAARLRTLLPMVRTTLLVAICAVIGLTALSEIGLNIAPLLAGAGVIGLAIGFGSQKLVQDIITGLFLLLENTMQVGDVVTLGGLSGVVEALSIRTIRLRASDGAVHIVPFSAVTTVTNMTRDFAFAVIDVQAGLNEDPDHITDLLKTIADEMRADPAFALTMTSPLEVWGLDKFVPQGFVLRVRLRTVPGQHWSVAREFNRRLKHRFDELAIQSPVTSYRALAAAMQKEA